MSSDSIKVVCRLRPLNKIEIANSGEECVTHSSKDITIKVKGLIFRLAGKKTSIALPSIASSAPTLNKSKSIKRLQSQSSME